MDFHPEAAFAPHEQAPCWRLRHGALSIVGHNPGSLIVILPSYVYNYMYIEIYRLNENFLARQWFQFFCLKPFLGRSNVFFTGLNNGARVKFTPGLFHLFAKRHCPVSSTMCFWFSWWFPIAILPNGTWGILNDPLHKGWSSSHECRVFYTQYFRNPIHDAWMTAAAIAQSTNNPTK